jgi:hypothetical protein
MRDDSEVPEDDKPRHTLALAPGPIRNQQMLESGVDEAYAFVVGALEESHGTYDMVKRLRKAGVTVVVREEPV